MLANRNGLLHGCLFITIVIELLIVSLVSENLQNRACPKTRPIYDNSHARITGQSARPVSKD